MLAYLAYSLQSGTVLNGMATMGALSAGTAVPLLLLGWITRLSGAHLRWGPKAGGIILVLLGLSTSLRGTAVYHHLLGCPAKPVLQEVPSTATKACCVGKARGNSLTVLGNSLRITAFPQDQVELPAPNAIAASPASQEVPG